MTGYITSIKAKLSVRKPQCPSCFSILVSSDRANDLLWFTQADCDTLKSNMLGNLSKVEEEWASSLREKSAVLEQQRCNHRTIEVAFKNSLEVSLRSWDDYSTSKCAAGPTAITMFWSHGVHVTLISALHPCCCKF